MGILDMVSQVLGFIKKQAKKEYDDYEIKKLINHSFSAEKSVRVYARAQLQIYHPEILKIIESEVK